MNKFKCVKVPQWGPQHYMTNIHYVCHVLLWLSQTRYLLASSKVACMSSYILFLKFRATRVNNSHASFVDCFMVLNVSQSPPTAHTDLPGLLHSPVCFRVSTLCTYTDLGIGGYFSIQHHSCFDLYLTCIIVVLYEISSYAEIYYIGSQLYFLLP